MSTSKSSDTRKRIKVLASAAVSLVLVFFLLRQLDFDAALPMLRQADVLPVIFAALLYLCISLVRAIRYRILLRDEVSLPDMLKLLMYYGFFLNFLPFRAGEIVFLVQLKGRGVRPIRTLSLMTVTKMLDFFSQAILFFFLAFALSGSSEIVRIVTQVIALSSALLAVLFMLMLIRGKQMVGWIRSILDRLRIKGSTVDVIFSKADVVADEMVQSRRSLPSAIALSILNIILVFTMAYMLVLSIAPDIPAAIVGITQITTMISSIIPIQGIAALGTTEGIWALVMTSFGIGKDAAILVGFYSHLMSLLIVAAGAMAAFLYGKLYQRQRERQKGQ